MSEERQSGLPSKIYAEAVVCSCTGVSLLRSSSPVTAQNVTQFYAQPSLLNLAADRLRQDGFEVLGIGKTSINIAADSVIYERSFKTKLEAIERPVIREMGLLDTAEFINSVDDKPFGEIDLAETGWDKLLDGVVINQPVYYHWQAKLPMASPPATTESYLSVPDGVAQGLNATLAHQQGITGKGVKVVMVDSGWYPHPFFTQHHYNVKVVLAPGSTHPLQDDSGHGTGESANLLAIAPEVSLTVVKADVALEGKIKNVNSIAALKTAVNLKPDIISCSWGTSQRSPVLSSYNRTLAAIVADAVRQGIIVVFSAGNGHYGFPAQHPEVIAAGGVYLHLNGSLKGKLEASNYSSSFISPVPAYKGRQIPDVCGLVGQLPHGNYILVPVPPGSITDLTLAQAKDGTGVADGWAALSGTSAAAPQLAGICALMKQINPNLSPSQIKQILKQTARDVVEGRSNPASDRSGLGESARAGPDLATGNGLADAYAAIQAVALTKNQGENRWEFSKLFSSNSLSSKELQKFNSSSICSTSKGQTTMNPDYPKLKQDLEKILWEFEKTLEKHHIKELKLSINESNFVTRSSESKVVYSLRNSLDECLPLTDKNKRISKNHVMAAKSLLKLNSYVETAREIITEVITNSEYHANPTTPEADRLYYKELQELAFEALGEICNSDELESKGADDFWNCDNGGICLGR